MNFNQSVEREVVDAILESSLWKKAGVGVNKDAREVVNEESNLETLDTYKDGIANGYDEKDITDVEGYAPDAEATTFTLDDLQCVLDNLEEEDLMEHALSMLDVFDVAYETLAESADPGDEDEDEEEEAEEAEEAE